MVVRCPFALAHRHFKFRMRSSTLLSPHALANYFRELTQWLTFVAAETQTSRYPRGNQTKRSSPTLW